MLVEDDSVDAMTVKRAFKDLKVANPLVHTLNGEDALNYLRGRPGQPPCVILLDLNMPKMNGIEFLKIAKGDVKFRKIPVVVLSTSGEEPDIMDSYKLNVAGYIIKPVDYKKFVEAVRTVNLYWTLSELPVSESGGQTCKP